jgi:hypothetical protein
MESGFEVFNKLQIVSSSLSEPVLACHAPAIQSHRRAAGPLLERHLATAIRRLLDRVDQSVQVDRGLKGRLVDFASADRPRK